MSESDPNRTHTSKSDRSQSSRATGFHVSFSFPPRSCRACKDGHLQCRPRPFPCWMSSDGSASRITDQAASSWFHTTLQLILMESYCCLAQLHVEVEILLLSPSGKNLRFFFLFFFICETRICRSGGCQSELFSVIKHATFHLAVSHTIDRILWARILAVQIATRIRFFCCAYDQLRVDG